MFDGYTFVSQSNPAVTIPVSGFLAPPSGPVRARLGVVSYDGDKGSPGSQFLGDGMSLNGTPVSDALNPANDVFNSTVTRTGTPVAGREPALANTLGLDADVFAVDGLVANGATSATIALTTGGESYNPGVVTTAFDLFAPTLTATKTVTDVDGGRVEPGDLLQYDVSLTNTGLDAATGVAVSDAIPAGTAYDPGSLAVTGGPGAGPATDAAGDDLGERTAPGVAFRVGAGAGPAAGGRLDIGATASVRFRVRVAAGTPAGTVIPNAATIAYAAATSGTPFTDTTAPASVTVAGDPVLGATKAATLASDADGSGGVSAGDTLSYAVTVRNTGNQAATGVVLTDGLDPLTGIVVGSVTTSQGAVTSGNAAGQTALRVQIGTLPPGASATVVFRARVASPLPPGTTRVSNQAVVTADGLPPVTTDDPVTVTPDDPTTVAVTGDERVGAPRHRPARPGAGAQREPVRLLRDRDQSQPHRGTDAHHPRADPLRNGDHQPAGGRGLRGGALVWTSARLGPGARRTVCFTLGLIGPDGALRRPVATAAAANAGPVRDAVRTRLAAPPRRSQPAVTG